MSTVQELLESKGKYVACISPEQSCLDAVRQMNDHKIGCLVVMRGAEVAGILTERDLLVRVLGVSKSAADLRVDEVMTVEVLYCQPSTPVDKVGLLMKQRRIRHVPVIDESGKLCGMVSIGDLNAHYVRDHENTIQALTEYIHGRV